jgi:hypothetical protein
MPSASGLNRVTWDMQYPGGREIPMPSQMVSEEYPRLQAPVAPPGTYTVRLTVAGKTYERTFQIVRDPRLTVTDADLEAQFELMSRISQRTSEITEAVDRLRAFRATLSPTDPRLEALHTIEGALTRIPGATPDMLPPKGLNNRLAALAHAVQQGDAHPTPQMYQVFEHLAQLIDAQLASLQQILKK